MARGYIDDAEGVEAGRCDIEGTDTNSGSIDERRYPYFSTDHGLWYSEEEEEEAEEHDRHEENGKDGDSPTDSPLVDSPPDDDGGDSPPGDADSPSIKWRWWRPPSWR